MEDPNDYDIDKDIPTIEELEKLGKRIASLRLLRYTLYYVCQKPFGNFFFFFPQGEVQYREVCWDLLERGTVGETALHLCLLNATSIHADLAKRLLHFYPKLVNDIYMIDEYYGMLQSKTLSRY